MKTSFQDGVDSIYSKCVAKGATPTAKTPSAINTSIDKIYTDRYNSGDSAGYSRGYSAGDSAGYSRGYSAGKQVVTLSKGTNNMAVLMPSCWRSLTINNFFVYPPESKTTSHGIGINDCTGNSTVSATFDRGAWSYDSSTGIFTVGNPSARGNDSLISGGSRTTPVEWGKIICVYPL